MCVTVWIIIILLHACTVIVVVNFERWRGCPAPTILFYSLFMDRMGCNSSKFSTPVEDIRGQQPQILDAPRVWTVKKEKIRRPLAAHYKRRKNRVKKIKNSQQKAKLIAFLKHPFSHLWFLTTRRPQKEAPTLPSFNHSVANTQEVNHNNIMRFPPKEDQFVDLTDLQDIVDSLSMIELDMSQLDVPARGQMEEEISLVALKYLTPFDSDFDSEEEEDIELPGQL